MVAKTQYVALNRAARLLFSRTRKLHEELKSGTKNADEAARLRRAFAEIRPDIVRAKELNHSRTQALAAHALSIEGATARGMLEKMSKVELHSALPHLINRANSGDKEALTFLGAAIGVIAKMPEADRPMTITKLARHVNLPEYDVAAAEIHEANFFLEASQRMLPRLEAGQLPSASDIMAIGSMRRELDGGGWRDLATLTEANADLRSTPKPDKETDDAPPDSAQHDDAQNPDGQAGDDEPALAPEPAPSGEGDKPSADQPGPESTQGAQ